jgi:DNA mismatch repair ATPase MutS
MIFNILKKLDCRREDIRNIFEYVGEIDSFLAINDLRRDFSYYCHPVIKNSHVLEFQDIYHPLIINCIPNSLKIKEKSILLTGSNMAGKTTFIRTVAINVLLAQTINTCFAKKFKLRTMNIFSAIRISDDLLNDKSYYFEEVLTIKSMIERSETLSNNLFLLDEIFKGTNTTERIAAGKAVLSYLAKSDNNIVFVSTHDIELAELLNDYYDLYHFTEIIKDNELHFDYKIKEGRLTTSNAIRILEINNYPKEIIDDARAHIISPLQEKF